MVVRMGFGWIVPKQGTCYDDERWANWELWYWWKLLGVVVGPWKSKAWIIGRSTNGGQGWGYYYKWHNSKGQGLVRGDRRCD